MMGRRKCAAVAAAFIAMMLSVGTSVYAQPSADAADLSDDELVRLALRSLDPNNLGEEVVVPAPERPFPGRYHGQSLVFEDGVHVRYALAAGVSCASVDGVAQTHFAGDRIGTAYTVCIPKILVDKKLDQGWVVSGPEFTDASLTAFALDFFQHGAGYRQSPPKVIEKQVAGTYRGVWVATAIGCDIIGSAEPQCLQQNAPLIVTLGAWEGLESDPRRCTEAGGRIVQYDVPNDYKPLRTVACVPKVLVDSGVWRQGVLASTKAEVLH